MTTLFDGHTFEPAKDTIRLTKQLTQVSLLMGDGNWRTLSQIKAALGCPEQSASARLRDLRKPKFGGHKVERRRVGESRGLHEYRVLRPDGWRG